MNDDTKEMVNHPAHYGGGNDPYEAIKVIDAWGASFSIGSALKYMKRYTLKSGTIEGAIEDLEKAVWYIQHEIESLEEQRGNPNCISFGRPGYSCPVRNP